MKSWETLKIKEKSVTFNGTSPTLRFRARGLAFSTGAAPTKHIGNCSRERIEASPGGRVGAPEPVWEQVTRSLTSASGEDCTRNCGGQERAGEGCELDLACRVREGKHVGF